MDGGRRGEDLSESLASCSEAWEYLFFRGRYQKETELGPEIHPLVDLAIPQSVRLGALSLHEDFRRLWLEPRLPMEYEPETEIDFLMVPEMFLDDECRIVAGSVVFLQLNRPQHFGPFEADSKPDAILEGRFVVNLDDLRDLPASLRTVDGYIVVFTSQLGTKGLKGARRWNFLESEVAKAGAKAPKAAMSVQILQNCPSCVERRVSCLCPRTVLDQKTGLSSPSATSWNLFFSSYMSILATRQAMTVIVDAPSYSSLCIGWSTDLIMNGSSQFTSAMDMRAKYLENRIFVPFFLDPIPPSASHTRFRSDECGFDQHEMRFLALKVSDALLPERSYITDENSDSYPSTSPEGSSALSRQTPSYGESFRRSYSCPVCEKTFVSSGNVARHIKMVHEKIKRYSCPVCGKGFYTKSDRQVHRASMHDAQPP